MALRAAARTELLRRVRRKPTVSGAEHRSLSGHMPDKPPVLAEEHDSHASRAAKSGWYHEGARSLSSRADERLLFCGRGFPPVAVAACRSGTAARSKEG